MLAALPAAGGSPMKAILLALIRVLPVSVPPDAGRELPLRPQLLRLRARGDRASTARSKGTLARRSPRPAMSPVSSGRLRPGSLNVAPFPFARPRLAGRGHPGCHGYPTSDPVRDLLVLRAAPVGGVAEGDAPAAGAGRRRGAATRRARPPSCRARPRASAAAARTAAAAAPFRRRPPRRRAAAAPGASSRSPPISTAPRSTRRAA